MTCIDPFRLVVTLWGFSLSWANDSGKMLQRSILSPPRFLSTCEISWLNMRWHLSSGNRWGGFVGDSCKTGFKVTLRYQSKLVNQSELNSKKIQVNSEKHEEMFWLYAWLAWKQAQTQNEAFFFLWLGLPSTLIRHGNGALRKRSSNRRNLKTPALCFSVFW